MLALMIFVAAWHFGGWWGLLAALLFADFCQYHNDKAYAVWRQELQRQVHEANEARQQAN